MNRRRKQVSGQRGIVGAVYARREQLAILDMLGASRLYLRGPFIVEALLQAFIAALLSYGLLSLCLYVLPLLPETPLWLSLLLPPALPWFIPVSLCLMASYWIKQSIGRNWRIRISTHPL